MTDTVYTPLRSARSHFVPLRGLNYHCHHWPARSGSEHLPALVMVHGWMDVGASFQFVVDALETTPLAGRCVIAPDWRGFGRTTVPGADTYWFPDYLADLDALLRHFQAQQVVGEQVDLLGHSMGGNVVMGYAGVRPQRVRRLINLEGFGLPTAKPEQTPKRIAQWLDSLMEPESLRTYDSAGAVAERLQRNNPRLPANKALWLAPHWAEPDPTVAAGEPPRWRLQADAAHKRPNPVPYHVADHLAQWRAITAPLLWVQSDRPDLDQWWKGRYSVAEFHERLNAVPQCRREVLADCGHMLHHDQPEALATLLAQHLLA